MIGRNLLLWASTNRWIARRAMRAGFVRRSVAAFMPGETTTDAIEAAGRLLSEGITPILTVLGENVTTLAAARSVSDRYRTLVDEAHRAGLHVEVSVKPTQLGIDQDPDACASNLAAIAERSDATGSFLWLDMERSTYVDGTLALYRNLRARTERCGVAVQAYLFRTPADVEALVPLGAAIRLVKGAYLEPASIAYERKADVDRQYFELASRLLSPDAARPGALLHIATHDVPLQEKLRQVIADAGVPKHRYAFAMLYGIRADRQRELVRHGEPVHCLISYGPEWFPWYMRRLAERPANVWFVVKNLLRLPV
jgi:proline dehydrogenase